MARGKKLDNETVYKIMTAYFTTGNTEEVSNLLDIPGSTVRSIIDRYEDDEKFAKLRTKTEDNFAAKATKIINKGTELLNKRLNTALEDQETLEEILEEAASQSKEDVSPAQIKQLVKKINQLQLNNLSEITTAIGTLYDKRALAKGEPTANNTITITVDDVDDSK